jgi:hypothetical protein
VGGKGGGCDGAASAAAAQRPDRAPPRPAAPPFPAQVDPNAKVTPADVQAALTLQPIDVPKMAAQPKLSELDLMALTTNDSTYVRAPPGVDYYRKPFEFLSLGIMAYVGNEKALVSAEVLDSTFNIAGSLAFLLWRSVYITKQARRGAFGGEGEGDGRRQEVGRVAAPGRRHRGLTSGPWAADSPGPPPYPLPPGLLPQPRAHPVRLDQGQGLRPRPIPVLMPRPSQTRACCCGARPRRDESGRPGPTARAPVYQTPPHPKDHAPNLPF